jgi:putative spermidine/putrescine transport system substrate-binding protein
MQKSRLRVAFAAAGLLAVTATVLTGCRPAEPEAAAGGDASLSVNAFGGVWQEALEAAVIAPFESESGTSVSVTTAISSEALAQLRADSDVFDVAYMDLAVVEQAKEAGLLQPLDLDAIPNSENLYPIAVDENGYWVAELTSMTGIAYNTEAISTPPTSWADLWNDEYAGRVAISNVSGTVGYQFLVQAARLNGGSEENIDPGFEAIEALKPNIVSIYNTPDEMSRLLTSGEAWLGPWYADRTGALKASGAPVEFVEPEEGAIAILSAMVIPKDSPNVEGALDYIDFQLAADINSSFVQATGTGPTNSLVELPQEYLDENFVPYGTDQVASLQTVDPAAVAANLSAWIERWNAEIAG